MGNQQGSESLSSSDKAKLEMLMSMGFDESPSVYALRQANGDVNAAVQLLTRQPPASSQGTEQRESQREILASAAAARQRQPPPASKSSDSTTSRSAPKLPAAPSQESQLQSLASRLAAFPEAVDSLLFLLSTIQQHPNDVRYRQIKVTNRRFRETIAKSGELGVKFLKSVGFTQSSTEWLSLSTVDSALIWLAKSALEEAQKTPIYANAKSHLAFQAVLRESQESASVEEAARRSELQKLLPSEPPPGAIGTTRITVFFGQKSVTTPSIQRTFRADDTLQDICNWVGSEKGSVIPAKLRDGSWEVVDATLFQERSLDAENDVARTLQFLDLWPSAELRLKPKD